LDEKEDMEGDDQRAQERGEHSVSLRGRQAFMFPKAPVYICGGCVNILNAQTRTGSGKSNSTSNSTSSTYTRSSVHSMALIDIHTHVYLPRYVAMLRSRSSVPRIFSRPNPQGIPEERLLILDREPSAGRPVGNQVCQSQLASTSSTPFAVLGQRGKTPLYGQSRH
jgi:hypothetical protein